jgi:glycine/D-amino acid oxidase-like deaminating enzyme
MGNSSRTEGRGRQLSRREACKLGLGAAVVAAARNLRGGASSVAGQVSGDAKSMNGKPHIAVIGAGAFGGWTAYYLLRGGAPVTLVDAWGPGNSRASSGGETRVIRGAYGPDQPYTKLAARALELWKEHQAQWKRKFFFPIGVLWMVEGDGAFERGSLPFLKDAGIPFEQLDTKELMRRWPQISFEKVQWGIYEPQSGYLLARSSASS